ncbi:cytochrome P450 [Calocera cornea HHB12733]|uniref:Cytochrome P450 n=1 Tax=Calocera cornea HHB12733 TaxID=1353952 RepID=A0A165D7R6_9BASI|nr:cytochrome P450 [Calocera cornea HHB12733]
MVSVTALLVTAILVVTILYLRPNRYAKLPRGPPGLPLLGNLLELPTTFMYLKLDEWSKQYGPVFSFNAMGQRTVVVNSVKAAGDILDRMSAHSSNRPAWIKANQFLSRGNNIVVLHQGETWRRLRKAIHEVLNIRVVDGFRSMQREEAAITIRDLLAHPKVDLVKHFHRVSASIAWRALYGGEPLILNGSDPSERIDELSADTFKASLPGYSIVDMIPPLRHLYASVKWFRKDLDKWFYESTEIYRNLYRGAKDASVLSVPCVANSLSKLPDDYGISQTMKAWTAGALFTAGQDTTATTLRFFVLAMVLHPEVVRKAQTELDAVVGDSMPTFDDKDKLPYVCAVIKEVARWHPAVPLGVPHAASDDFEYNGYIIPRGTWILDNIWSQTHDPTVYPEPEKFNPSRFLNAEGHIKPGAPDSHDDWLGFGHGRRICPGRDLASNSLFIVIASLLWAVEFGTGDGEVAPKESDLVDNFLTVQPAPFKVTLVPRFKDLDIKLAQAINRSL